MFPLTVLEDLGYLKCIRTRNIYIYIKIKEIIVLNRVKLSRNDCLLAESPHLCLVLAGSELFKGIREPRWFLIYKKEKKMLTQNWLLHSKYFSFPSFILTLFPAPWAQASTFNIRLVEMIPKALEMIWKGIPRTSRKMFKKSLFHSESKQKQLNRKGLKHSHTCLIQVESAAGGIDTSWRATTRSSATWV